MSAPNPFESGHVESAHVETDKDRNSTSAWQAKDYIAFTLWVLIPMLAAIGYFVVLPIFEDFGTVLPVGSRLALSLSGFIWPGLCSIFVLVAMFAVPRGRNRNLLLNVVMFTGAVVIAAYFLAIAVPLTVLLQNLS